MLGAATQMSSQADMSLRVPSLFAALFMVAQGLYELDRIRRDRLRSPQQVGAEQVGVAPRRDVVPSPAGEPNGQVRLAIPVVLMCLGGWLGLAVLRGSGGPDLILNVLATLSAFLLFAIGWQVLLGSR